jgi:hypothetical protein
MNDSDSAIQWLLNSADPSMRYFTLADLLEVTSHSRVATTALDQIPDGHACVQCSLDSQQADGRPMIHWRFTRVDRSLIAT